jgi:hypothetical protein
MRDDLMAALQVRWDDSLRARAAIHPHSPVPLLDGLLAPDRERAHQTEPATPRVTQKDAPTLEDREKMISQIPPKHPESPTRGTRVGLVRRASDLVKDQDRRVELRGFEPLTPSMRTPGGEVVRGRCGRSLFGGGLSESLSADGVAVFVLYGAR